MKFLVLAMLIGTITGESVQAQTGNSFIAMCADSNQAAHCTTYITGFVHGLWSADMINKNQIRICFQAGVTSLQVQSIVEKFMRENPELLHLQADILIVTALERAFPCSR